jgi:hypothetical protein
MGAGNFFGKRDIMVFLCEKAVEGLRLDCGRFDGVGPSLRLQARSRSYRKESSRDGEIELIYIWISQ